MKFTISYKTDFGTISAESKKPEDLVDALDELKKIEKSIRESRKKPLKPAKLVAGSAKKGDRVIVKQVSGLTLVVEREPIKERTEEKI
ncbi:MAG: hypothetical protein JRN15_15655 [Nitrososphaerota archaeon]|nr:hypothetical protein [Nitrososphaerota archaeon]